MILDELAKIQEIDPTNFREKISQMPAQIETAWQDSQKLIIPSYYLKVNKVVITGVGGSIIAGFLIKNFLANSSDIPIYIHQDYQIPGFVDNQTLVIAVSCSGNTEETIDAFQAANSKGAKLIAITTGGQLALIAEKFKVPVYQFNYQSQPRAGLGFLFGGILGILKKLTIADIIQKDIDVLLEDLKAKIQTFQPENKTGKNLAKQIALEIQNSVPCVWGEGILETAAKRWKNQINENANQIAFVDTFPELNHNTIQGLDFPKEKNLIVLILESKFAHPRNKLRIQVSRQILDQKEIPNRLISVGEVKSPLSEMFCQIVLGDFMSYYLAILNGTDPEPVEIIQYLKQQMKK